MPEPSSADAQEVPHSPGSGPPTSPAAATEIPEFQFERLSQGAASVRIKLGAEVYTLRRTRAEKLVLNK